MESVLFILPLDSGKNAWVNIRLFGTGDYLSEFEKILSLHSNQFECEFYQTFNLFFSIFKLG